MDITVHITLGEVTDVVVIEGDAVPAQIHLHLKPLARRNPEARHDLPVGAEHRPVLDQHRVNRHVDVGLEVQPPGKAAVEAQARRVLQQAAGKRLARPVIDIQGSERLAHLPQVDGVGETVLPGCEVHDRVVAVKRERQPAVYPMLKVQGIGQLRSHPVGLPRFKPFPVLVNQVAGEAQVVMPHRVERQRQTRRVTGVAAPPGAVERQAVSVLLRRLFPPVVELRAHVAAPRHSYYIIHRVEEAHGLHRELPVKAQFEEVLGVVVIYARLVEVHQLPHAIVEVEVLPVARLPPAQGVVEVYAAQPLHLVAVLHGLVCPLLRREMQQVDELLRAARYSPEPS